jgi:hypothetical protein
MAVLMSVVKALTTPVGIPPKKPLGATGLLSNAFRMPSKINKVSRDMHNAKNSTSQNLWMILLVDFTADIRFEGAPRAEF